MTGYQLYRYYISVKLHFTKEDFNVFEHKYGQTVSVAAFNRRRDKVMFERLAKKFKDDREGIRFLVANWAHGNDNMIWSDWDVAQGYMIKWNKTKQSLSKVFADDLDYLNNKNSKLNCTENQVSVIIKEWKAGKIQIETVCLLCELNPTLLESWKSVSSMQAIYGSDFLRIQKLIPFVKINDTIKAVWGEFAKDYFTTEEGVLQ